LRTLKNTQPEKRILFITLSNIGDAIMTTPVIQSLHNIYPDKKIDIVVDQRSKDIFSCCPFRGEIFIKDKKLFLRGAIQLVRKLRNRDYDLIVDLRTDGLSFFLRGRKKLTKVQGTIPGQHAVEQHMKVIQPVYNYKPIPDYRIWVDEADKQFAELILKNVPVGRYIALGPGANSHRKIWPTENYSALIDELSGFTDVVLLLGSKRDCAITETICKQSSVPTIDLCGRTSILQAAALMQHAMLYIGNDSGLGHIAAAMNIPTCTIFGPNDPARYRPWGDKAIWIKGQDNIKNISTKQVISLLNKNIFNTGHQQEYNL
jgi:heptosyltransferase III